MHVNNYKESLRPTVIQIRVQNVNVSNPCTLSIRQLCFCDHWSLKNNRERSKQGNYEFIILTGWAS